MTQVQRWRGDQSAKAASPLLPFLKPLTWLVASRARSAGNKARDEKHWRDAAEAYARFLRLRPNSAAVWTQLGHCLKESGDPAGAEGAYLQALELDPDERGHHSSRRTHQADAERSSGGRLLLGTRRVI